MNLAPERRNPAGGPGSDGASLGGGMQAYDTPDPLQSARTAIDKAKAQLDRYALETDCPDWRMVDAADRLDATRAALDGAP